MRGAPHWPQVPPRGPLLLSSGPTAGPLTSGISGIREAELEPQGQSARRFQAGGQGGGRWWTGLWWARPCLPTQSRVHTCAQLLNTCPFPP